MELVLSHEMKNSIVEGSFSIETKTLSPGSNGILYG
jgi:hypothetical protein